MTPATWTALWPLLAMGIAAVAAMVSIALHRCHKTTLAITLIGLGASIGLLIPAARVAPQPVGPLLMLDGYALFFIGIIAGAAFVVALLAYDYLSRQDVKREEFYVLLLIATLGASVLASANHFATFFLGLEVLSVSLYSLNAYLHQKPLPLEAGIKYLVLASSSAAFLLFGMAMIYMATGSLGFPALAATLSSGPRDLVLPGLVLLIVGFGFKLGLVPFHLWAPDVYQGAPAPVSAFVATASKAGMFALLVRFFEMMGGTHSTDATLVITVIAIASMVGGNLLAVMQSNVKRILAYSSIAHMGYLLVAFEAVDTSRTMAAAAIGFYFFSYFLTMLGAFGIISAMSNGEGEPEEIKDFRGLFWRRPWLALVLAAMMFSLAGIPLTAGFIAKIYIVSAGISSLLWLLVLVLVITSVVGLFYYLRVVVALFLRTTDLHVTNPEPGDLLETGSTALSPVPRLGGWILACLLVALVWVGVYPQTFLHLILSLPLR